MLIREFLGEEAIKETVSIRESEMNLSEGAADPVAANSLMVDIEGIHVGPTRNFTWYTENALKNSIPTWTRPYGKPMIKHHNEENGDIIGRIKSVEYTDMDTLSKTGALIFTVNVPDKDGKEQIQDGRLKTVSIGVSTNDVKCSICGQNLALKGVCEHKKGAKYLVEGVEKTCYWVINSMEGKEISYVVVPSDPYAMNRKIYNVPSNIRESEEKGVSNLSENLDKAQEALVTEDGANPVTVEPEVPAVNDSPDVVTLKSELEEAKANLEETMAKLAAEKEKSQSLQQQCEEAVSKIEASGVLLQTTQKELKDAQDSLKIKEAELVTEVRMKESLEEKLQSKETELMSQLIENYNTMRKVIGKEEVEVTDLQTRTRESLSDSIKDMKSEIGNITEVRNITKVENPTFSQESKTADVKEAESISNVNLEERLSNVIGRLM